MHFVFVFLEGVFVFYLYDLLGFIGNAICSLPLCHFFVNVLFLTPMFALRTVKSPVFSLVHDRYHLNKKTAEGRPWCCFCQESQALTYGNRKAQEPLIKVGSAQ